MTAISDRCRQEALDTRPDCESTVKLLNKVYGSMMAVSAWVIVQIVQNDLQIFIKFGKRVNNDTHF
jgi:hypothetical protein